VHASRIFTGRISEGFTGRRAGRLPAQPQHPAGETARRPGPAEKGSIILTSNRTFSEWGQVFGDEVLATAILDRLLHHCDVISINGPSYRLKNRLQASGR
jgi:hypothetical protein